MDSVVTDSSCWNWAETYGTCGGSRFCPCGTSNCDAQWPKTCCKSWDVCVRKDSTWWRCEPRTQICGTTVPTWKNCGGNHWCPSGTPNCDAPWPGKCCGNTDVCVRKSRDWWRCEPKSQQSVTGYCTEPIGTWAMCGGNYTCPVGTGNCDAPWPQRCCSASNDVCIRKDATWWRCEPQGTPNQPPKGTPPPPLVLQGNRLVNAWTGGNVAIRGVNWFGFNVGATMVDGLWAGGSEAATDFQTITYQLRLLGFNAVRLPFRWADLDMAPKDLTVRCTAISPWDLRNRLLEPGWLTINTLPDNVGYMAPKTPNYCNTNIPNTNTYERLLWTVQVLISQGMYVVLDYQPMGTESQPYNVKEFTCKWTYLWKKVAALPNFKTDIANRVFVDVMNEPDSMNIKWESSGGLPGAHELYLSVMDALYAVTPDDVLFMVEGAGQTNFGLNWGNGFITDSSLISRYGLSDPNAFFQDLLSKPYVNRVVLTPHVYPPSITKATFLGTALWQQSAAAFGYLQSTGYCMYGKGCRVFPVLVGETGSTMLEGTDISWHNDFADFLNGQGGAKAYNTVPLNGWLWWAYNENSGDTGGLVYNNWQTINWQKLGFLINRMGLLPWYMRPSAA
eukprot:jgi/Chrzof1/10855/Cz05g14190.t1